MFNVPVQKRQRGLSKHQIWLCKCPIWITNTSVCLGKHGIYCRRPSKSHKFDKYKMTMMMKIQNNPNTKTSERSILSSSTKGRVQKKNQNGNSRWHLPLDARPPPPLMAQISRHFFLPHFFLLRLNPTYMKRILHFKNITFKSSYNWFKIDIHQQLRPLTANY